MCFYSFCIDNWLTDEYSPLPFQLCIEVDRMRPTDVNLCQLWRQNVTKIVPKVIELVQGKTPPAKVHSAAREEILMEEIQGI